ncbi:hypothetical protein ACLOJK_025403 [Asimina triloba]
MDGHNVDAWSSLLVLEATGDSEADAGHGTNTAIGAEHKKTHCTDVVAVDDAESCSGDQSWETMAIGANKFQVSADDQCTHGEMGQEEEEGVVDSWRRVQVMREMNKEEGEEEDRLFWERCLAMGFP